MSLTSLTVVKEPVLLIPVALRSVSVDQAPFNAKGDGVTDDTLAIQAAIDYIASIGGGEVRMSGGPVYRGLAVLKPMVRFIGLGSTNTTLKAPDNWSGVAVVSSVDFQAYFSQDRVTLPVSGSYGAELCDMTVNANYTSFAGTPGRFSGNGVAIAGITIVHDIEVYYAPGGAGFVHLGFAGSPNFPPAYYPNNRGLAPTNAHTNISVKHCRYDCMYIENADSIYTDVLAGFASNDSTGTSFKTSLWDTTRTCAVAQFAASCNVRKAHFYSCNGYGVVWGHGDYTRSYNEYRYENIVGETLCTGMWVRPTASMQGVSADFHNINMALTLPEISAYGAYAPGCLVQSGQFIVGQQTSRPVSNLGAIKFWNFTVSGSNPVVGFQGTHLVMAGENNTVDIDLHRSRFLDPALGGLGIMNAGINNTIRGRVVGFLGVDSSNSTSCALQVQPGSSADIDLVVHRCALGLRWSTSSTQPVLSGRVVFKDNVTTMVDLYQNNASLFQRGRLLLENDTGSNKMSVVSAAGSVDVALNTQQVVSITGLRLPYVPTRAEVLCQIVTEQSNTQSRYIQTEYLEYRPELSTVSTLVFVCLVVPVPGAAAGACVHAKIN